MKSVQIDLPPLQEFTVPLDADFGRAVFESIHAQEVERYFLNGLEFRFRPRKFHSLTARGHAYPKEGIYSSGIMRVERSCGAFKRQFEAAASTILKNLGDQVAEDSDESLNYFLELGWSDAVGFSKEENLFGDFLYLYARIIKTRG